MVGCETSKGLHPPNAVTYMQRFLSSAAQMDTAGIEESLEGGFALGSFEHLVDSWLFPTLEALGLGAREIDVAGEQVIDRLNAHLEVRAQLGQGKELLDQLELRAARIGARSGRGVHEQQVRQPHRARSRDSEKPRWIDRVEP